MLEFHQLSEVNAARCKRWHGEKGVHDWPPEMWCLAAGGEWGELANVIKKLKRHDTGMQQAATTATRKELVIHAAMEIGDTVVYLDLLAQRLGVTLEDCVRGTFNRVSEREGFPERL